MRFKLHTAVFVLLGLFGAAPQTTFAKDAQAVIVADNGDAIRLCGRIRQEMRWGPPGFGETPKLDAKRSVFILRLQRPAAFRHKSDAGQPVDQVLSKVQISLPSSESRLAVRRMTGRAVVLEGPVWSASSEGDVTPVVLQMTSVSKIDRSTACSH